MNARGLIELIILNIGFQKGVIQPPLFSIIDINGNQHNAAYLPTI